MGARGTPFAMAVVASALALLLLPDAGSPPTPDSRPAAAVPAASALAAAVAPAAPAALAESTGAPAPPGAPVRTPLGAARTLRPGPVSLAVTGYWSWALLDRRTGELVGAPNLGSRSDTASMIKAWIAADVLRRTSERGALPDAARLRAISLMIRDSNNTIASDLHRLNGGAASIARLTRICGLTDTVANNVGSWSTTAMSTRDAVRMGRCLADGRAAGPRWTGWLLGEMRLVRGVGRFGIVEAFAADVARTISIKNGWIARKDGRWHISCLAIGGDWVLAVMTVYPARLGLRYGAGVCRQVAQQLAVA